MPAWLSSLPHQIPFRAASTAARRDEKTIEGTFLCTTNDFMTPEIMVVEAMAQCGGGLVFGAGARGMLSGIDGCEVTRPIIAGDLVRIVVKHEGAFGLLHRFSGSGSVAGLECVRGRFYLAEVP